MPTRDAAINRSHRKAGDGAASAGGRWVGLIVVAGLIAAYLSVVISFGFGMTIGDGGYWLMKQRDALAGLPNFPGTMTPLTDVFGGLWLKATDHLGLYGARLGWVAVNTAAAAMVYIALSRWFSALRVGLAVLLAMPLICHQQFTVLEYNNIPWFWLLTFGLIFQRGMDREVSSSKAAACSVAAGIALGVAVLTRLPLVPSLILPAAMWFVGLRTARETRLAVTTTLVAVLTLAAGLGWMLASGAVAEIIASFKANSAVGTAGVSGYGSYSAVGLAIVYIAQLIIGIEQVSVALVALAVYLAARAGLLRTLGPRWLGLTLIPIAAAVVVAMAGAVVAKGTFNPRFLSGFPFMALVFCAAVCWMPPGGFAPERRVALRQLCLLAVTIPVLTMAGSNMGLYRVISAAWLTVPLAIVLIPDVSSAIDRAVQRLIPTAGPALEGASRWFLYGIVAMLVAFGSTYAWKHGSEDGPFFRMNARSSHPRLRHLRDRSSTVQEMDAVLAALEPLVRPGDIMLAYPNLEMLHFVTDSRWPLAQMFVHEPVAAMRGKLERQPPACVVFRDNSASDLWKYSESRRKLMDRFLVDYHYEKAWSGGSFTIYTLPQQGGSE